MVIVVMVNNSQHRHGKDLVQDVCSGQSTLVRLVSCMALLMCCCVDMSVPYNQLLLSDGDGVAKPTKLSTQQMISECVHCCRPLIHCELCGGTPGLEVADLLHIVRVW